MNKFQEDALSAAAPNTVYKIAKLRLFSVFLINILIFWFWISQIESREDLFLIVFAIIFLFFSLRALILLIYHYDFKVVVSENDIAVTLRGVTSAIPWKDIKILWRKVYKYSVNFIPVINIRHLNIEDVGGKILKLSGLLNKFDDLSNIIVMKFNNLNFSHFQRCLENGETIHFGPFALTNKKISYQEKKSAYWQELGGVQFWQGSTFIKNAGSGKGDRLFNTNNWTTISFLESWKIPNYDLMLMMINHNIEKNKNSIMPIDADALTDKRGAKKWYDDQERIIGIVLLIIGLIAGWFGAASPIIDALNQEPNLYIVDELILFIPPILILGFLYLALGPKMGKVFSGNKWVFLVVFILITSFLFLFIFNKFLSFLGYS
jgi:hypothetical protein